MRISSYKPLTMIAEMSGYQELAKIYLTTGMISENFGFENSEYFQYLHSSDKYKAYDLYRACIVSKHKFAFSWNLMAFFPPFHPTMNRVSSLRKPGDLRYLLSLDGLPSGQASLSYLNHAMTLLSQAFTNLHERENMDFLDSLGFVNASQQS
ncbi:hypothetical protein [Limnohabitans sp. DM1]|uniref:hypothetical protein n=1 Tax=Limnohabitans sp. DM1 TaxID=1597955 RepID=UPI001892BE5C|nr:hypothetical protein [Limnohabitans sp. DM1]